MLVFTSIYKKKNTHRELAIFEIVSYFYLNVVKSQQFSMNDIQHHKVYYKTCDYKVATFKSNNIHDRFDYIKTQGCHFNIANCKRHLKCFFFVLSEATVFSHAQIERSVL